MCKTCLFSLSISILLLSSVLFGGADAVSERLSAECKQKKSTIGKKIAAFQAGLKINASDDIFANVDCRERRAFSAVTPVMEDKSVSLPSKFSVLKNKEWQRVIAAVPCKVPAAVGVTGVLTNDPYSVFVAIANSSQQS